MSFRRLPRLAGRKPVPVLRKAINVVLLGGIAIASSAIAADASSRIVEVPSRALEAPLTLSAAQRHALERSRQLTAQDYAVTASREMAVAAGELPDPVLRAGIENLPVSGSDRFSLSSDFMTMRNIGISQEITRGDKRRYRKERFEREADVSLAEKAASVAEIQRDTALAWFDLYYAKAMAAVIAEQIAQADLEIQTAEGAYRANRGNQASVYMSRSTRTAIENRASEIERRKLNGKALLARWVGDAASRPLAAKPSTDELRIDPNALENHLAHHPEIVVLSKLVDVAQAEAKLADANRRSDWTVSAGFSQRGSQYSNMASIGVSIPLQWNHKNRQDRELSAKLAMVEKAKARRDEALRAHVAEVQLMINEWQNNRERYARYEKELIPLANDRISAAVSAYRGGKATLNEVLAARRDVIDVRLEALDLKDETDRLWTRINFLFPDNNVAGAAAATDNIKLNVSK
jgi:outer membrane protein TolC